jgi:hypothetical protein
MRRMRIVVVCLVGACALSALAAGSASAASPFPELGRCFKVSTPKTGAFTSASCIGVAKTHKGEYEWASGPGAKKGFKAILTGPKLENTKGEQIVCSNIQLTGEYTGAKTLKITKLLGQGCENATHHTACASNPLINPSVIESEVPLVGEIGFIPGSKIESNPFVGADLKSENSSLAIATFTCGEAKGTIAFMLEGSVIGRVTKPGVMVTSFGLTYKQTGGVQNPTSFIGGPEDVLKLAEKPFGSTETIVNQAGLASPGTITNEEALEIKQKV